MFLAGNGRPLASGRQAAPAGIPIRRHGMAASQSSVSRRPGVCGGGLGWDRNL